MFQWVRRPERHSDEPERESIEPKRLRVSVLKPNSDDFAIPTDPNLAPMPGVGPLKALKLAWARRDQFEGRASRSEYWSLYLWGYAWILVVGGAIVGAFSIDPDLGIALGIGFWLATIPLMIGSHRILWAAMIRRLHDTGRDIDRSGLWRLRLSLTGGRGTQWAMFRRGDPGGNRFGPGPRGE